MTDFCCIFCEHPVKSNIIQYKKTMFFIESNGFLIGSHYSQTQLMNPAYLGHIFDIRQQSTTNPLALEIWRNANGGADAIATSRTLIRHDSNAVASAIIEVYERTRRK